MSRETGVLEQRTFGAEELMRDHPPVWRDPNKEIVYGIACPPGPRHSGTLAYSRWAAMPLPEKVDFRSAASRVDERPGFYDYEPTPDRSAAVEWHVNFADPILFVAYGSLLFAQDEMQVAEHPALGALREALIAEGLPAVTVDDGLPTPVLVRGVERRCVVATDPNAAEGRPLGLYGGAFGRADPDAVRNATRGIDPPTVTNLIAMAAPRPSKGPYSAEQIEFVLRTACTALRAAVLESREAAGGAEGVVVHSGFWGCGAFGGNRVLMTTLQVVASTMAGVDLIVFHTGDPTGTEAIEEARRVIGGLSSDRTPIATLELIRRLDAMGFEWATSDGS